MIIEDIIFYGKDAMNKLVSGINKVGNAVSSTMGPAGRSVILGGYDGKPTVTKDGVSVADYITLVDPTENMGAELIKQAARNTVKDAGDGTTTSTVLTQALVKHYTSNDYSIKFKEGALECVESIIDELRSTYKVSCDNLEDLYSIALTSANGDEELAKLVSEAVYASRGTGDVKVEMTNHKKTTSVTYNGYKMNSGWLSSEIITNPHNASVELGKSFILTIDGKLENFEDIMDILRYSKDAERALVIIAHDFDDKLQRTSVKNFLNYHQIVLLKAENFNDYRRFTMEDLAIYVDSKLHNPSELKVKEGMPKVRMGDSNGVEIYRDYTIIKPGDEVDQAKVDERIKVINNLIGLAKNDYDAEKLKLRVGQLSGGYSCINIGGHTEAEVKEKFDRAEDAVGSAMAAIKYGVIPGGGNPLYKIGCNLLKAVEDAPYEDDFKKGWRSTMYAICEPFNTIVRNTGMNVNDYTKKLNLHSPHRGLNAKTMEIEDLIESGVIDPIKVTESALNNAVSVALLVASVGATLQNSFQEIN